MEVMAMNLPGTEFIGSSETTARTIMVVDDADMIRNLISLILRNKGHDVLESRNGKEALQLLADKDVDILITDLNMPEMDGIELVKAIRSKPESRFVPVIMVSSEFLEARKQQAYEAGINHWIPKPFIVKQLTDILTKYTQKSQA